MHRLQLLLNLMLMVRQERYNFWQAISGALNLIGTAATNRNNKKMQQESMAHQSSEREASQEYQTSEREASQDFQRQMTLDSQSWQDQQRNAQNDWSEGMYNKYQSPAAMALQYKNAGLNPRLAVEGTAAPGASSGSSGGAPSSGASSGSAPQGSTVTPPYQSISAWSQGFGNIAQAMKSLAEAKKTGVETKELEETLQSRINLIKGEETMQKLNINWTKVKTEKDVQSIENLHAELSKTNAEEAQVKAATFKLVQEGLISKQVAETFMEDFHNRQENIKADTANKSSSSALANEQIVTEKTKQTLNNSIVSLNKSQVSLNKVLENLHNKQAPYYESLKKLNDALSYGQSIANSIAGQTKDITVQRIFSDFDSFTQKSSLELEALRHQVEKLEAEGKYAEARELSRIFMEVSVGVNQFTSAITNAFKAGNNASSAIPASSGGSVAIPFN